MSPGALIFEGRCWTFGHDVPTDAITPTHLLLQGFDVVCRHVLAAADPAFPKEVRPGDIICAGRNFGCSSGRAVAPKAIKAIGVSVVIAESFARTFYRNAYEIGLPILELPGVHDLVKPGDRLRVDLEQSRLDDLTSPRRLTGPRPPAVLLEMLRAGGLIPFIRSRPDWVRRGGGAGR